MQSLTGYYRNEACRALAEKVNRREAAETLNVKVNVHLDLGKRDPAMVEAIMKCMEEGREFVMYQDKRNYTMFVPTHRLAVCIRNGNEYQRDISKDGEEYITRVKMSMMGYENFYEPVKQIDVRQENTLRIVR